jgi:hypothetical protein
VAPRLFHGRVPTFHGLTAVFTNPFEDRMDLIPLFWTCLGVFTAGFLTCWFARTKLEQKTREVEAKAQAVRDIFSK